MNEQPVTHPEIYTDAQIRSIDTCLITVETSLENVLIKGKLSAEKARLWGNNTSGYYSIDLITTRPAFKLTGSFFQRQL